MLYLCSTCMHACMYVSYVCVCVCLCLRIIYIYIYIYIIHIIYIYVFFLKDLRVLDEEEVALLERRENVEQLLRSREIHRLARSASGVSICTFVLVKQVLLY